MSASSRPSAGRILNSALAFLVGIGVLADVPAVFGLPPNLPVSLPPQDPPAPLPEADRRVVLAAGEEDGLVDPPVADLELPETLEDLLASLTPLPEEGAPSVDAFALPTGSEHVAVIHPNEVNKEDESGDWGRIPLDPAPTTGGWDGQLGSPEVSFPHRLGGGEAIKFKAGGRRSTSLPSVARPPTGRWRVGRSCTETCSLAPT